MSKTIALTFVEFAGLLCLGGAVFEIALGTVEGVRLLLFLGSILLLGGFLFWARSERRAIKTLVMSLSIALAASGITCTILVQIAHQVWPPR
jgi:hypothetical protein